MSSEYEADDHWAGPSAWVSFVKYLKYLLCLSYVSLNCHAWTCVEFFPFELSVYSVQVLYVYL
jgi:hypothetical protein